VSKGTLDVAVQPEGTIFQVSNDESGHRQIVERLTPLGVDLIVLEATGGYQAAVAAGIRRMGRDRQSGGTLPWRPAGSSPQRGHALQSS
jgi:transposase